MPVPLYNSKFSIGCIGRAVKLLLMMLYRWRNCAGGCHWPELMCEILTTGGQMYSRIPVITGSRMMILFWRRQRLAV
jgi:hypothetical protein